MDSQDSQKKSTSDCVSSMIAFLMPFWSKATEHYIFPMLKLFSLVIHSFYKRWFSKPMTLQIEEHQGSSRNKIYDALELYLQDKTSPSTRVLKVAQIRKDNNFAVHFGNKQEFDDVYKGIELKWKFNSVSKDSRIPNSSSKTQFYELVFDLQHKEKVMSNYLPYVLEKSKVMKDKSKVVKIHTLVRLDAYKIKWEAMTLEHPASFETIAMDPEMKKTVVEDLDQFVNRKEFYQRVGRAWKRGYLLYGPPGTGKSTLIAAMANYLKFDVFDLQLTHLKTDMELRKVLLATMNKSILVIEDIDCSQPALQDRKSGNGSKSISLLDGGSQLTLSGLLNFTDGLWSSCGEERIIVFTTNHKSKLDPALLRSGRMDMHIHMSYCTFEGFKTLASNYLRISEHPLVEEIEKLVKKTKVTPAQVAEELMKNDQDPEAALQGLIAMIKKKKNSGKDEYEEEDDDQKQLTYFI